MGSAISFSGFNDIDFGSIVNALMQQASAPLTALQTSQAALKSRISAYSTLGSRVTALNTAATALSDLTAVSAFTGRSGDAGAVGVSTTSAARAGRYDVVVNELARSQVTVSTSSAPDTSTTVVASGGTLTIGGVGVAITGDVTLDQLAQAINGTEGIGVHATAIRTAANTYRLALTSRETGQANAFTVTNGLTGGTGVTFGGTNAVEATDAALTINNIPVTSGSNVLENVVAGVTLTLARKDPAATVVVEVVPDAGLLRTKVEAFVAAYNNLVSFAESQRSSAAEGSASSIGGDPLIRQLRSSLRASLLGAYGSDDLTRLSQIGIAFTQTGTLQLNRTLFDAAVSERGEDVQALLAGAGGAFTAVKSLLGEYSQSTGFIRTATAQLNAQIRRMDSQIAAMQDRLAAERLALQQQFAATDTLMSRLNGQRSALANFGSNFGTL